MAENLIAWSVLVVAFEGRQFDYVTETIALPMGGTLARSQVVAFRYEAVLALIDRMAPVGRRREVFEKFRWIEPYALGAVMGGGNAKGSNSSAAGQG